MVAPKRPDRLQALFLLGLQRRELALRQGAQGAGAWAALAAFSEREERVLSGGGRGEEIGLKQVGRLGSPYCWTRFFKWDVDWKKTLNKSREKLRQQCKQLQSISLLLLKGLSKSLPAQRLHSLKFCRRGPDHQIQNNFFIKRASLRYCQALWGDVKLPAQSLSLLLLKGRSSNQALSSSMAKALHLGNLFCKRSPSH